MAIDTPKALEKYPVTWLDALAMADKRSVLEAYIHGPASYKMCQIQARHFRAFRKAASSAGLLLEGMSYRTRVVEKRGYYYLLVKVQPDAAASGRNTLLKAIQGD